MTDIDKVREEIAEVVIKIEEDAIKSQDYFSKKYHYKQREDAIEDILNIEIGGEVECPECHGECNNATFSCVRCANTEFVPRTIRDAIGGKE